MYDTMKIVHHSLSNLKAHNINVLDVRNITSITDHMVVATGNSITHVKAIASHIILDLKKHKRKPIGIEGEKEGEWILIDLGDIVVHVMQEEARDFYNLEKFWTDIHAEQQQEFIAEMA